MDFIPTCFPRPPMSPQTLTLFYKAKDEPPPTWQIKLLYHVPTTPHPSRHKEDMHQDFSLYSTIHWCMRSSVTGCLQRPNSFLNTRTLLQASSKSTQLKKQQQHAHLWPVILFSYFYWSNSLTNSSGKVFYHNGSRLWLRSRPICVVVWENVGNRCVWFLVNCQNDNQVLARNWDFFFFLPVTHVGSSALRTHKYISTKMTCGCFYWLVIDTCCQGCLPAKILLNTAVKTLPAYRYLKPCWLSMIFLTPWTSCFDQVAGLVHAVMKRTVYKRILAVKMFVMLLRHSQNRNVECNFHPFLFNNAKLYCMDM